jgi:hypothetical protein
MQYMAIETEIKRMFDGARDALADLRTELQTKYPCTNLPARATDLFMALQRLDGATRLLAIQREREREEGRIMEYRNDFKSSRITRIGYDAKNETLSVTFKDHRNPESIGIEYHYSGVPQQVYDEFVAAESKGKFFEANVRKHEPPYPYKKIEPSQEERLAQAQAEAGV